MQFERNRMYRAKQVAQALDVSVATIYRAIESGDLQALKIGTGKGALRVPGRAAQAYVESCAYAAYQLPGLGVHPAVAGPVGQPSREVA